MKRLPYDKSLSERSIKGQLREIRLRYNIPPNHHVTFRDFFDLCNMFARLKYNDSLIYNYEIEEYAKKVWYTLPLVVPEMG